MADEYLLPTEVAARLCVDPRTVGRWARTGLIAAIRTPGGHIRIPRSALEDIEAGRTGVPGPGPAGPPGGEP